MAPAIKQTRKIWAIALYAGIVLAMWARFARAGIPVTLGGQLRLALLSFALLLAPLWFFGFGLGEWLVERVRPPWTRSVLPALLGLPYLVFAIPAGNLRWLMVFSIFLFPVVLATLLNSVKAGQTFVWQDAFVLASLSVGYLMRILTPAWPYPGLSVLPKLYVADLALYLYLVVRKLGAVGYSFSAGRDAFLIGLREWAYFLPIGIGLGAALRFIHFHARVPSGMDVLSGVLVTFLLVAVPEEMFFRGILQNLLETRLRKNAALLVAAGLFGLAHFNKGADFNWRYVLLASIAGIFYGRAWRAHRRVLASSITHTAIDVVWSLWFR
jgi:membrane protease YdiL (CAAX protease family)